MASNKTKTEKKVRVNLKDLYQLLIESCRYAYTRNNHLQPYDAYNKVKDLIPVMMKSSPKDALHTIKQLCDECISDELNYWFHDGEEDEYNNRELSINFIKWCLDYIHKQPDQESWYPYNYDLFLDNLAKDDEPRYNIYDITDGKPIAITTSPASKNNYKNILFNYVLDTEHTESTYNVQRIDTSYWDKEQNKYIKGKVHFQYYIYLPTFKIIYVEHI